MEIVELERLTLRDWAELTGREREPFGERTAGLAFRPKDRHLAVRSHDGRLLAACGTTLATVRVAGTHTFDVVGIGALIVRPDARGRKLSGPLMDRVRAAVGQLGPQRAMLFCEEHLVPLYARRGYRRIDAPVRVDQPHGRIEMPTPALWRPLRPCTWPPGVVELEGLPF